MNFLSYV